MGAIKAAMSDEDCLLLDSFKYESAEPAIAGSTAAVCLVNLTQGELIVSNLGDSHVILAERDPQTDLPHHIVRGPLDQKGRRIMTHPSDDLRRHTSQKSPVNDNASRRLGDRSPYAMGQLGSVSTETPD